MQAFFDSLDGLQWFFFICASVGGSLFLVRLTLMLIGGVGDDMDIHADGADAHFEGDHFDGDHDVHGDHGDADVKLLTFQGITAFFTIFGLTGLGCVRGGALGTVWSSTIATASGLASAWIVAKLLAFMVKMQSSGTLDLRNAIGVEGEVYLTIPPDGIGKVRITLQERLSVLDASARNNEEIRTGERVCVVDVSGTSVLVVEKA